MMNSKATTLILVRHGHVVGEKLLVGHTDVPLSEPGREGVRATAKRLSTENISALYSSDLSRSVESASIIGGHHKLTPVQLPAFRELYMGRWDGKPMEEVWKTDEELIRGWWADPSAFKTPEGESLGDLRARVVPALHELVERHVGETVCLVAHGGVNRVILFEVMNLPLKRYYTVSQDYACVNRIRFFDDGKRVVDLMNG